MSDFAHNCLYGYRMALQVCVDGGVVFDFVSGMTSIINFVCKITDGVDLKYPKTGELGGSRRV